MKGGEDRPDNCPPCPVCEERMKEPKQTGFFANFFKNSEGNLKKVQTDAVGIVKQSADDAKKKTKILAHGIMGPINNFIGTNEQQVQQPVNNAITEPQEGGRRRRRTKHKKHTNKKHLKKGTTKKRGLKKRAFTKKRNVKRK